MSIALATFNGARFLAEQLASIATQTIVPDEIVVGDDGSSDATLDIIADFAATVPYPVHVERNPTRLGFGLNFLRILGRCAGGVIVLADQDDVRIGA